MSQEDFYALLSRLDASAPATSASEEVMAVFEQLINMCEADPTLLLRRFATKTGDAPREDSVRAIYGCALGVLLGTRGRWCAACCGYHSKTSPFSCCDPEHRLDHAMTSATNSLDHAMHWLHKRQEYIDEACVCTGKPDADGGPCHGCEPLIFAYDAAKSALKEIEDLLDKQACVK